MKYLWRNVLSATSPPDSSASHPDADQEGQGHPQEYHYNNRNGQERNVEKEGADTPQQQYSAEGEQADFDHGRTSSSFIATARFLQNTESFYRDSSAKRPPLVR
jgi:hypothetical protein